MIKRRKHMLSVYLVLSFLIVVVNGSEGSISRTVTLRPQSAVSLDPTEFDELLFQREKVFPAPMISLTVVNDTLTLNSKCKAMLTNYGIQGPRMGSYIKVASVGAQSVLDTATAGQVWVGNKLWSRDAIKSLALTNTIWIELKGDERYSVGEAYGPQGNAAPSSPDVSRYTVTLPSACLVSSAPPVVAEAVFSVKAMDRNVVGQIMSFLAMVAGVLCALCSLIGALLPLLLLQVFAALTMVSCASPALLAETYFSRYLLFPAHAFLQDYRLTESTVLFTYMGAAIVVVGELIHFGYQTYTHAPQRQMESEQLMSRAAEEAMLSAAKNGIRQEGSITFGGDDDDDDTLGSGTKLAKKESHANTISSSITDSIANIASEGKRKASRMGETLQSVRDHAAIAATKASDFLPMAPYIGCCFLCMFFVGVVVNCGSTVLLALSGTTITVLAVLGLLVIGVGVLMLSIGMWMKSGWVYSVYRISQGGLPNSMQVTGVWGPNHLRLRYGIFCEDFRDSRRVMGVISIVYALTISLVAASSPGTRANCTTAYGIAAVATFGYSIVSFGLRPMRSPLNNYCLFIINLGTFCYECSMLAYVSQAAGAMDSSAAVTVGMGFGCVICLVSVCFAISHLGIAFWEIRGARAARHAGMHSKKDTLDAEMLKVQKELAIEEGVREVLRQYELNDDEHEGVEEEGFSGVASGHRAAGMKHKQQLAKARLAAINAATKERISGMRYAHERVRPGTSLAIGDDHHPSYAEYLLVDYNLLPEQTRKDFKSAASARRDVERSNNSGLLSTLTFEERMILQGSSQYVSRIHRDESRTVPHIYSTSTLPPISPQRRREIAEELMDAEMREREAFEHRSRFEDL